MTTLNEAIRGACEATAPFTKARLKALSSVKWRLRSPAGQYIGHNGLTNAEQALIFDGRDNEALKTRYYSAILGVPITVELISFGA